MKTTAAHVNGRSRISRAGPAISGSSSLAEPASHFCEAIGQLAIDTGRTVAWFSIEELGALVRRHSADDIITKAIRRFTRANLIIVDDIGMLPVGEDAAAGFYRLVDAYYEKVLWP
jgi:DNA replication protein DnaC